VATPLTLPAIVASVLGADYSRLGEELADLETAGVDAVQWDVMDGRFVPNLTFGPDLIAACRESTSLPFEAHLMIEEPERSLDRYITAGCETVIVHAEASTHLHRTLSAIADLGARPGVALNPATPLEAVRHLIDRVGLLLVMTVNPGFGGQAYIRTMEAKIGEARKLIDSEGLDVILEVDGGIGPATISGARSAGADLFVSGSAILGHPAGKAAAVAELRQSL
jgi:ribulose-phosphate 3-epimerase